MRLLQGALALFDRFLHVPRAVVGALLLAGIGVNIANVVGRYVFSAPIPWAEEVMVFGMIWIIFLGAVLAAWDDEHLKVDLLQAMLPVWVARPLRVAVALVVLAICAFVAIHSLDVVQLFAEMGDRSPVARIPKWVAHGALAVGFLLLVIATAGNLARRNALHAATRAEPTDPPVREQP